MMRKIVALLITLALMAGTMSFTLAEETAGAEEIPEAAEALADKMAEDELAGDEDDAELVPLEVEVDPELARTMGLAAATAVAYGVNPEDIVYYDHLNVGNTTAMQGNFFTELWGNATSDSDVRTLLHGYNLIRWDGESGKYSADPSVVLEEIGQEDEATGDRYFTMILQDDLYYSDGTKITAWDYAFSFLLTLSPEIAELGALRERNGAYAYIRGAEAYMNGESGILSGVNVAADNTITIVLNGENLPYFFEQALLGCVPYPISVLTPGVRVMDDGEGVYLANEDENVTEQVFTAELLRQTIEGENGYRNHPTVVSGPYTLTGWDGTTAELKRNPSYKGDAKGNLPLIENISFTLTKNDTMVAALAAEEIDLLNKVAYVDAITEGMNDVQDEEVPVAMSNYPRSGLAYIAFSCERPAVTSESVRQAIAWCMDRDAITMDYTGNYGQRVDGYLGIGQWMYGLVMGTTEPPISETEEAAAVYGRTIEQETEAWEALTLDNLTEYRVDLEAAAALLDRDGWRLDEDGIRSKIVDGVKVRLELTMIYPEGNRIGEILEAALVPNLAEIGIGLTMRAVPMLEMNDWIYAEERQMDMFFQAVNFDIIYDPAAAFDPADEYAITRQQDQKLYELAAGMNATQPGDTLSYVQKWVAFEERVNELLPVIPLYSNVYFDFYTETLHDYQIAQSRSWGEAILGATKVSIPDYEIPMVPAETEDVEIGD